MSHGTNILFNISLLKLSELSPSQVLNVTEILESLIYTRGTYSLLACADNSTNIIIIIIIKKVNLSVEKPAHLPKTKKNVENFLKKIPLFLQSSNKLFLP